MNLILSPSAIRDLQEISDYTLHTWGAEQENRYLKGLWGKLAEIQSNPDSCRLRDDLAKGCRSARMPRGRTWRRWPPCRIGDSSGGCRKNNEGL